MVLKSSAFGAALLVTFLAGAGPQELVVRLGSPRYADREAASSALEKLGPSAFPALKVARADRDPEVKSRAELLLDTIERSMLTRPTTLHLQSRRYSLAELAERLGKSQGLPLSLGDVAGGARARSFLELHSDETLSFWSVLDRAGLVPGWEFDQDFGRAAFRRATSVTLVPKTDSASPTFDHGPFRLVARPLSFEEEPNPFDAAARQRRFFQRQEPPRAPQPAKADEGADLVVRIEMMAEPRLSVRSFGAVRLLECVDDQGQAIAPASGAAADPVAGFVNPDRGPALPSFSIRLRPPSAPARVVERLRGVVPVEIEARKIEPTVISLSAQALAEHRPVDCGGMRLQIQALTPQDPAVQGGYVLDMAVHPEGWIAPAFNRRMGGMRRGMGMWDASNLNIEGLLQNLEVVDAQGRPFEGGTPRLDGFDTDALRIRLFLPARDGSHAPPTDLRVFGQIRALIEVPFEFRGLKLPGEE